jgi:hypothetical protein
MELEANISSKDLLRFAAYNLALTRKFGMPFETVIITKEGSTKRSYTSGSIKFTPKIINLTKRNGKTTLNKIKKSLAADEAINELEIIFLPLYNHPEISY